MEALDKLTTEENYWLAHIPEMGAGKDFCPSTGPVNAGFQD